MHLSQPQLTATVDCGPSAKFMSQPALSDRYILICARNQLHSRSPPQMPPQGGAEGHCLRCPQGCAPVAVAIWQQCTGKVCTPGAALPCVPGEAS